MKNNHFIYKKKKNNMILGNFEAYTNLTLCIGDFNDCFIVLEFVIKDILNIRIE